MVVESPAAEVADAAVVVAVDFVVEIGAGEDWRIDLESVLHHQTR